MNVDVIEDWPVLLAEDGHLRCRFTNLRVGLIHESWLSVDAKVLGQPRFKRLIIGLELICPLRLLGNARALLRQLNLSRLLPL